MKIKICGITKLKDAQLCANLGADAIGFIFYPKSKRYIAPENAKSISLSLPPFVHKIGVFVNEEIEEVNRIAGLVKLTAVQLHGNESLEYISQINYPVIKSFGIDGDFDFSVLAEFNNCGIILDVKDTINFGGTGKQFDWNLIPKNIRNKIIIAGGVGINNIEEIHTNINPYGIDISSSVEVEPGIKDKDKLEKLFEKYNKVVAK
ncbi:MAG: N-(5'-phosphoribosyl)anthranilate isomerase [Ignavibacteriales bacterium CG18_big_fil_WC_8_21_14_2_50_31_20]|nr:MAG: N-(5'-phosphoribosyl)anthranilate isomerase [Ignavibacteriales bacterium CG18_big_fil_WC_8_21_14_2_50_31_20]